MTMQAEATTGPAPDQHPGQATYETNGAVALPGDTAQVYHHFVGNAVLHGMVLDEGGELQKVIAGPHNIGPGPDGRFTFGQSIPNGAYCIAIVKNVTEETKTLRGAFLATVKLDGAPVAGSLTSPNAPAAGNVFNQNLGGHGASTSPRAPGNGGSPTVTPGMNEIAVLLPYGEAKRLLDIVNGGMQPLSDSERAGVARAFHHAFQRSGMG